MELKKKFEISFRNNFEKDLSDLLMNLELDFKRNGFRIIKTDNALKFRRIISPTTHSGNNKRELLQILRSGKIVFEKAGRNSLLITYSVDLGTLIIFSIGLLVFFGLFSMTSFDIEFLSGLLLGILPAGLLFFIGYIIIEQKLNSIINRSVEETTRPKKK